MYYASKVCIYFLYIIKVDPGLFQAGSPSDYIKLDSCGCGNCGVVGSLGPADAPLPFEAEFKSFL